MKHRTLLILVAIALALAAALPARGTVAAAPAARALSRIRIAFTQHNNVYIMNADGSGRTVVTTRGTSADAVNRIWYPWYQWSPSGRYLLLERAQTDLHAQGGESDNLLLMDANGNLVRSLVTNVQGSDNLLANWALDRDVVAYVQGHMFKEVDISGKILAQFSVVSQGLGCGGGPPPPADQLYWNETGYEGVRDSVVWSMGKHLAAIAYGCASPVLVADTTSGRTQPVFTRQWAEPALSVGTKLAMTTGCQTPWFSSPGQYARSQCVLLVDVRTGSLQANLRVGELPAWSRDGRTLYFVRRTGKQLLHMTGPFYVSANGSVMGSDEPRDDLAFVTSIWMTHANGSHPLRIASLDAFGTGPLQVTRDGRSLIFSLVDNPWNLYHHLLPSGRYTAALLQRYGPHASIRRLDLQTGKVTTIIRDAGRPAVQP